MHRFKTIIAITALSIGIIGCSDSDNGNNNAVDDGTNVNGTNDDSANDESTNDESTNPNDPLDGLTIAPDYLSSPERVWVCDNAADGSGFDIVFFGSGVVTYWVDHSSVGNMLYWQANGNDVSLIVGSNTFGTMSGISISGTSMTVAGTDINGLDYGPVTCNLASRD